MQAELQWLTDPAVFRVNRLHAHSDHICFRTAAEAAAGETSLRQSLDGLWRFRWSRCPAERPADFWQEGFDDAGFGSIQVPGHMELQGFGQIQYINTLYPWDGRAALRPPEIDWDDAPVGSYVRTFDLAPGLRGQRVCISFQGAEQALYVWLNGHFIGYAEDSFTPSEFDLTPYIKDTGNRLCAEVHKRCSASWIEDQDFFRFSGLFRSVYLFAKPALHLEDLWVQASLCPDLTTGELALRLKLDGFDSRNSSNGNRGSNDDSDSDSDNSSNSDSGCNGSNGFNGREGNDSCDGSSNNGDSNGSSDSSCNGSNSSSGFNGSNSSSGLNGCEGNGASSSSGSSDSDNSSNGSPSVLCEITHPSQGLLYRGTLPLKPDGEYFSTGTMQFEQVSPWSHEAPNLYHITLTLRAADGTVAEVVPYDIGFRRLELRDGVIRLNGKRLILNGVNRHEWNPERGRAITLRDMEAAIETFRRNNISAVRTCHYPNQTPFYHLCDQNGIYMMDETNLESHGSWQKLGAVEPSWNVPGSLPEWKDCVLDRARSMFERDKNHVSILFWSCGNESYAGEDILAIADFFRAADPSRLVHYEGVFHNRAFDQISDVESRMYAPPQAVREYLPGPKPFLLCEYMHDMGNSLGGMESYIRLLDEFPQYQGGFIWDYMDQALWRTDVNGRRVLGYGGDFGERQTDYAFSGNGIVFADGTEKPAMQEVRYWYLSPEKRARWDAANDAAKRDLQPVRRPVRAPLRVVRGDGALGVRGSSFEILFSYPEAGPVSLRRDGREWLWRAPRPAFWRAPTENDLGSGFARNSAIWNAVDLWQVCEKYEVRSASETEASIVYTYASPAMPGLLTEVAYTVDSCGVLTVSAHYHGAPGRPQLPLFGLRFATPVPVETVRWVGLSGETYPDRKKGGRFGCHQAAPQIPDYLVPQECGCHVDTHAFSLLLPGGASRNGASRNGTSRNSTSLDSASLDIEMAEKPFAFSAIPYTPHQLEQAAHKEELPLPVRTVVTICGAMRGVGGIDSWGADVEPPYHIHSDTDLHLTFRILL